MENQQQADKQRKKNVIVPLMIVLSSIIVAYFMSGVGPAPQTYQIDPSVIKKIDSLEQINEQLVLENIKLDSLIEEYRIRVGDLDWKISEMMKRKSEAQDRHHDIIEAARSEDAEATQEFFKQRYNF